MLGRGHHNLSNKNKYKQPNYVEYNKNQVNNSFFENSTEIMGKKKQKSMIAGV